MKYVCYSDKINLEWHLVYCNNHTSELETKEEIARAITTDYFVNKFVASKATAMEKPIKNDEGLFILQDTEGTRYIWQIKNGQVWDYCGATIPNLYQARIIGFIWD